jgi:lipopolysaccharide transport system ATP-binding protein
VTSLMADKKAIYVKNLGKKYLLGGQREQNSTFRDLIVNSIKAPFRAFRRAQPCREFWALKDVSFEVKKGEVVGIIGRNGAGKSTLLKILSRITSPTEGCVKLHGHVGSLLEVGTGFHSELSGRENIYLSGSILGMKKTEIDKKFDDIVKFSEIEKFLDTPVKRYSSGMYIRLAFAVAAHLDPEVLIIDEVLAVGDAQFQKKCLSKMGEVAQEGRTVLFVSHNMNAIEQLCSSCILLENGQIIAHSSNVKEVVRKYLFSGQNESLKTEWLNIKNGFKNPWFHPTRFFIGDGEGQKILSAVANNDDTWVYIKGEIQELDSGLQLGYGIFDEDGVLLYWTCQSDDDDEKWLEFSPGTNLVRSRIPKRFLNQGLYRIEMFIALYYRQWICQPGVNAPSITLNIQGGLSESSHWLEKRPGVLAPVIKWERVMNMETTDDNR